MNESKSMEKENYFVAARRQSIQNLNILIKEKGKDGFKHKALYGYMGVLGYREKTVDEYLTVLQNAGFIKYNSEDKTWVSLGASD